MNSRLHSLAVLTSAAVLALGVSGCSSDDDKKASPDKSPTPSATSEKSAEPAPAEQAALLKGIADAHAQARSAHVEMTLGAAAQQITAKGDLKFGKQPDSTAMSVGVEMAGNKDYSLSMIMLDRALFLNLGQVTGNKYGEVDLDDKQDETVAIQFTPLAEQLDPKQQFTRFANALSSLEKKGEPQEIDGVQAQPYEVVLDTKKIPGMEDQPKDAPKTVTYTVFIGPDQLVRRVTTGTKEAKVQADYTAWDKPVRIKAPKSSQISATALDALRGGS